MKPFKQQRGFTLVEIAIVLVIIGILLGGVLKGQELIYNSKIKRLLSQIKEAQAMVLTYYDKYGALPGDDASASSRWSGMPNGNGNGTIDGGYCNNGYPRESCYIWQHLRSANITTGNANDTTPDTMTPKHVFGGKFDVFSGTFTIGSTSRTGLWVTVRNLEAPAADALDRAIDDGRCTTGAMGRYSGAACSGADYPTSGYLDVWINT